MSGTEEGIDRISPIEPNGIVAQDQFETEIKMQELNYFWVIHHFDIYKAKLVNGKMLKSPLFSAGTNSKTKWYLGLQPSISNSKFTRLYLRLDDTSDCKEVFGKYKISFLDENKKELCAVNSLRKLVADVKSDNGYIDSIKDDDILKSTNKLTIYCEITFSEVDPPTNNFVQFNSIKYNPRVPELRVVEDIKRLFENEAFTDLVISAKSKNYKVHKTILIARSPVFAAMFKDDNMKENQQNKIDIPDFDEKVVEEMLNFIYTGKSENLETLAVDLLAAAEKYGLNELRDMSVSALVENLSAENAIDMLILAELRDARQLKSKAVNFIVAKSPDVMRTAAWKNIAASHPELLVEVCEALSRKISTSSSRNLISRIFAKMRFERFPTGKKKR